MLCACVCVCVCLSVCLLDIHSADSFSLFVCWLALSRARVFTRPSGAISKPMLTGADRSKFDPAACSWDLSSRTLKLVLAADVAADASVALTLDKAVGITLPTEELTQNQRSLTIAYIDKDSGANSVLPVCAV